MQPSTGLKTLQALENDKKVVFRHLKNNVFRYSGPVTRNSSMFKVQILFNIKELGSNMFQVTVGFGVCFAF